MRTRIGQVPVPIPVPVDDSQSPVVQQEAQRVNAADAARKARNTKVVLALALLWALARKGRR